MLNDAMLAKLREAGVDVDGALERFLGNTDLFHKFLIKFLDDSNMKKLRAAMAAGNVTDAFSAAHTLKGVCGNLSLIKLQKIVSEQTELLRKKDMAGAAKMMPEILDEYNHISTIIREL